MFWETRLFPDLCFANISSQSVACLFIYFTVSFLKMCPSFFMKSVVFIISLMFCAFCILSKKSLPRRCLIALALTFTSMIHCKLISVCGTRWSSMFSFPLPLDSQLFQYHLLKSLSFSTELSWQLCWKSIEHTRLGLFLNDLFCLIELHANPHARKCADNYSFIASLKIRQCESRVLPFLPNWTLFLIIKTH